MSKKGPTRSVIGYLDKNTRLSVSTYSFDIEVLRITKDGDGVWLGKYFYSDVQSAIRGYAKYKAKELARSKKRKEKLDDILDFLKELDATIKNVGEKLQKTWDNLDKFDPVEGVVDDS